ISVVLYTGFHFFQGICLATEAINLRPTSHTRLDPMPRKVASDHLRIFFVVPDCVRPWPDQRHCPIQYIEDLRKLIKTQAPQYSSDPSDPRIVACSLYDFLILRLGVSHCAKFIDLKGSVDEAIAPLPEQCRSLALESDRYRD